MLCIRCKKPKKWTGSPLCFVCSHQRSASQLFRLKRLHGIQKNIKKANIEQAACNGMNALHERLIG